MTSGAPHNAADSPLTLAIGLIWGHLNARRFEEAYALACGCAGVWPGDYRITMMLAYAAVETGRCVDPQTMDMLKQTDCPEWRDLILRRAFGPGFEESQS